MSDPTKGPDAVENQPADRKLVTEHPELFDASLAGQVAGPAAPASTPASAAVSSSTAPVAPGSAPSERPPVGMAPLSESTAASAGNDSRGIPRPHGPGAGQGEKAGYARAREQERQTRATPKR